MYVLRCFTRSNFLCYFIGEIIKLLINQNRFSHGLSEAFNNFGIDKTDNFVLKFIDLPSPLFPLGLSYCRLTFKLSHYF